ncbi:MAG: hypothetical protein JNJ58_10285 [Chitinophagaceae bacterium]|nr:hypothetical protein [Chitinophagaceae bacterium]
MKTVLSLSFLCTLSIHASIASPISILTAVNSGKAKVIFTGNDIINNPTKSSHTGKCLKMQITNTDRNPNQYKIENALALTNSEKENQDLIIAENMLVTLKAGESQTVFINAFCSEKSNSSPTTTDTFTLQSRMEGPMLKLTEIIERRRAFNNCGQQAVWCFTDDAPIDQIIDTDKDTATENELIRYVASVKALGIPTRKVGPERILRYPVEIEGKEKVEITTTTTVGFYITDTLNKVITTLMEDDTESRRGTATYTFKYRGQYPFGKYLIQMKKNGVWIKIKDLIVTP